MKQQIFDYYQLLVPIFLTEPKDNIVYFSVSGGHIVVLTKSYQKN